MIRGNPQQKNLKIKNFTPYNLHRYFFYLTILFLPTQLAKHFWPSWSLVNGLAIDYLSPTFYLTDVLIVITLVFWIVPRVGAYCNTPLQLRNLSIFKTQKLKNNQQLTINNLPLLIPLIILILYILFSPHFLNPLAHLFKLLKILELFLFGFYVYKNVNLFSGGNKKDKHEISLPLREGEIKRGYDHINKIAFYLAVGILFESVLVILQFINQHSMNSLWYYFGERFFTASTPGIAQAILNGHLILRPYGTFPHPNSLAGYFLVCLFLILSLRGVATTKQSTQNYSMILNSCFIILILFLSFSRSAWLVAGLTFLIIGLINIKRLLYLLQNIKFLIVFLIFAFCLLPLIAKPVSERLNSISTTDVQSVEKRMDLNRLAIMMFKSSPLIGVGLNNFIPNIPRFTRDQPTVRFYQPVHNIYLLILSETGLVGFFLFLFGIYQFIKVSLRGVRFNRETKQSAHNFTFPLILNSFFVILILGLFDHYWLTLQQNQLMLALIVGIALRNLEKKSI